MDFRSDNSNVGRKPNEKDEKLIPLKKLVMSGGKYAPVSSRSIITWNWFMVSQSPCGDDSVKDDEKADAAVPTPDTAWVVDVDAFVAAEAGFVQSLRFECTM